MVQVIARRKLRYPASGGKVIPAGGTFNVTEHEAFLLTRVAKSADLAPVPDEAREGAPRDPPQAGAEPAPQKRGRGRPRKLREQSSSVPGDTDPPTETDYNPEPAEPVGEPEAPPTGEPGDDSRGPRRFFRRRDMRAED